MAMASVNFHYSFVLVFIAILLIPSKCYGESVKPRSGSTLFVFGDSLFDPGNNQYINGSKPSATSNRPYGETFFKHPTGRVCDGRIVPDLIALFAKLPILPPYLQPGEHNFTDGTNFASAGAGVLDSTHSGTINLNLQLSYFKNVDKWLRQKIGDAEAKKVVMRAVYLFSIGGNDYFSFSTENPNVTASHQKEYVGMVIGNLTNVLKEVYKMGGRNIAFQNAGPLGCTPGTKAMNTSLGGNCDELPSALARRHNKMLSRTLKRLESQLPGFKYSIFDYYNSLYDRVFNPAKYGFKEGKAACCGSGAYRGKDCGGNNGTTGYELCSNPYEYVWFDQAHTTEGCNWQLAKLLWEGSPKVIGPYNLKQLFNM
ncbi:GDSL esterase/lipase 1-like [Cornus florida]|uniref:GDSL esterase/lipase 1-like n=1 Tax=Cornus florida TaxID=4283 RepID=UPI002899E46C|nr:GDSL esterase/lipase 1-like [Cornus florida]